MKFYAALLVLALCSSIYAADVRYGYRFQSTKVTEPITAPCRSGSCRLNSALPGAAVVVPALPAVPQTVSIPSLPVCVGGSCSAQPVVTSSVVTYSYSVPSSTVVRTFGRNAVIVGNNGAVVVNRNGLFRRNLVVANNGNAVGFRRGFFFRRQASIGGCSSGSCGSSAGFGFSVGGCGAGGCSSGSCGSGFGRRR